MAHVAAGQGVAAGGRASDVRASGARAVAVLPLVAIRAGLFVCDPYCDPFEVVNVWPCIA